MTRRLFYLNAVLLLGIVALGMRLRSLWDDARQREEMIRLNEEHRLVYHAPPPAPQVQAVNTASYSDVAMRMLFSRDRNPTVIIEVPVKPPEPPPPPFPKAHGVMMMDPPRIILTARAAEGQKIYKAGDKVGDYEIVSFDSKTIELRWHDKDFKKELSELADVNPAGAPVEAAAPPPPSGSNVVHAGGALPPPPSASDNPNAASKACDAGETAPAGTMRDGYKLVRTSTPFGSACRWVPSQ